MISLQVIPLSSTYGNIQHFALSLIFVQSFGPKGSYYSDKTKILSSDRSYARNFAILSYVFGFGCLPNQPRLQGAAEGGASKFEEEGGMSYF